MSEYLDIEALWKLASAAPALGCPQPAVSERALRGMRLKSA